MTGFISDRPEPITTDNLLTALTQARYMHERLLVAYYAGSEGGRAYHMRGAYEALGKIAPAMGFVLKPIAQDDGLPSAWASDDMHIYNVA